jgi:hypothetical protein
MTDAGSSLLAAVAAQGAKIEATRLLTGCGEPAGTIISSTFKNSAVQLLSSDRAAGGGGGGNPHTAGSAPPLIAQLKQKVHEYVRGTSAKERLSQLVLVDCSERNRKRRSESKRNRHRLSAVG